MNTAEKYFLIAILAVLIALFSTELIERIGVFYSKSMNNAPTVPAQDVSQPKILSYEEYLQEGIQYESAGEMDKAIDAYQKAAEVKPEAYVPYSNLGSIYERNKEFPKAEEAFKRALSINPQSVSVYRKLYELYRYDLKQSADQIILFLSDALEKTDNDVDLMKLYASYLEDINDLESALAVWRAFLQAEPNNEPYTAKIKSLEARIAQ